MQDKIIAAWVDMLTARGYATTGRAGIRFASGAWDAFMAERRD